MEFYYVGMFQLCKVFENLLNFFLLRFKIFSFRKLNFIPHDFNSFFRVHGQVSAVDSRNISLFHLQTKTKRIILIKKEIEKPLFKKLTHSKSLLLIYNAMRWGALYLIKPLCNNEQKTLFHLGNNILIVFHLVHQASFLPTKNDEGKSRKIQESADFRD